MAAQYQLAYLKSQNQATLYASEMGNNVAELKLRYAILQSKFRVLAYPSKFTHFFREIPSYDSPIQTLREVMARLDEKMLTVESDPRTARLLLNDLQNGWAPATANCQRNARRGNGAPRKRIFRFLWKARRYFISGGIFLILFSVTIVALTVGLRRQHIALNAEQQAIKAKNAFLAVVSHELRTPLQSITAAVDVLVDDEIAPRQGKILKRMESAASQSA
jgi:signal transduction histidine kinase